MNLINRSLLLVSLWGLLGVMLLGVRIQSSISDTTPRIDPKHHENYRETIQATESVTKKKSEAAVEMVAVPGGVFWMGSPEDEPGRRPDEGPQHPVRENA